MGTQAFVELALRKLSCTQKELAERMNVSPTQISKWKKGEYMSEDMEKRFREIVAIGDRDPDFVLMAGSLEDAIKWEKLMFFLADLAQDSSETGYFTDPLDDELGLLCPLTFEVLESMGVSIPSKFPEDLNVDFIDDDVIYNNPFSSTIYRIYSSLTDVWGFYVAYISDLFQSFEDDQDDIVGQTESELVFLAASKIEVDSSFAPNFQDFCYEVNKRYEEWLLTLKNMAFRKGVPLRAELLNMVRSSSDELSHEAEAESLGFNKSRLHPDIYMNELLCGMRKIHQILPVIMKKIGVYDDFELDESNFHV